MKKYDRTMDIIKLIMLVFGFAVTIVALYVQIPLLYGAAAVFGGVSFILIFAEVGEQISNDELIDEKDRPL